MRFNPSIIGSLTWLIIVKSHKINPPMLDSTIWDMPFNLLGVTVLAVLMTKIAESLNIKIKWVK